jgi:lipoprotein-anchoring transpeptidase ErfK/SrfK
MNTKFIEAREHVVKAREALRRGDKEAARIAGERAALLVPDMEDAWLVLAASDPNPQDALAYAQKALKINPGSARSLRAVDWASGRLKQAGGGEEVVVGLPLSIPQKSSPQVAPKPKKWTWIFATSLGLLACAVLGFAAYSAVTHPAFADIIPVGVNSPVPTQEDLWASADVIKPTFTLIPTETFTPTPQDTPTPPPTDTPMPTPTETATFTPEPTETPGSMAMEILADTPTSEYVPPEPAQAQAQYPAKGNGARWIDVDLSQQRVYAYEGDVVVNSFLVSTGTARTPTVTGKFKIWIKLRSTNMRGPGYYLTNVPYTMYFYKGYGLHGTYWHNNFGTPMSHGCVNLSIPDAEWLYNWAYEGTVVKVHY